MIRLEGDHSAEVKIADGRGRKVVLLTIINQTGCLISHSALTPKQARDVAADLLERAQDADR